MGEIRVICPGCQAEYRVDAKAIPVGGRAVECSDCGRIWQVVPDAPPQTTMPRRVADPALGNAPLPPSRRLPSELLDILHEEVAREQALRQAEAAPKAAPPVPALLATTPDWPATTITGPLDTAPDVFPPVPRAAPTKAPPAVRQPQKPAPDISDPADRAVDDSAAPIPPAPLQPVAVQHGAAPAKTAPASERVAPAPSRGYAQGLLLALTVAGLVVILYALTPPGDDTSPLAGFRTVLDQARLWLQAALSRVTG